MCACCWCGSRWLVSNVYMAKSWFLFDRHLPLNSFRASPDGNRHLLRFNFRHHAGTNSTVDQVWHALSLEVEGHVQNTVWHVLGLCMQQRHSAACGAATP